MTAPQSYRGERIGLPESGRGSLAPTGARLGAYVVDALASALVAALFLHRTGGHGFADRLPGTWSLIPFAVDYVVGLLVAGRTLGMHLFGLRVTRVSRDVAVDPLRAVGGRRCSCSSSRPWSSIATIAACTTGSPTPPSSGPDRECRPYV